ncbi:cysteine and histidine-rich domain-containing protein 1 [Erpetoichthys calabaricus]|uniref:cysteine and histidine-rich domain-containing protein 1 n=1 Tax=Erpetoichthys calabaricus TaxID=27687 RepID=UPI0022342369|nr:cysteine and histidine-rich domain-containing protein 1 [Erpetoichthys calabaricus]
MALLCYNKGCGERFNPDENTEEACLSHPGVPIFHDALKGWSCCRKRTTDFSEFLSIKGCTRGRHNSEKPEEPLRPDVSSEKGANDLQSQTQNEIIFQGPKSAEKMLKERPSPDEPKTKLSVRVMQSLAQAIEKMKLAENNDTSKTETEAVVYGTKCKNTGCKAKYNGPETDAEICIYHPGSPVFHEGYKYWSCCCIKTTDFNAFLDQKGCGTAKHLWVAKKDKKMVSCRHDWHQTACQVVITVYAKNTIPDLSYIEANRTGLAVHIQFDQEKVFHQEFYLWGVINVEKSFVTMVPSKVEVTLIKNDLVSWGKLEDPKMKAERGTEAADENAVNEETKPEWEDSDDDISLSDSDEEFAQ